MAEVRSSHLLAMNPTFISISEVVSLERGGGMLKWFSVDGDRLYALFLLATLAYSLEIWEKTEAALYQRKRVIPLPPTCTVFSETCRLTETVLWFLTTPRRGSPEDKCLFYRTACGEGATIEWQSTEIRRLTAGSGSHCVAVARDRGVVVDGMQATFFGLEGLILSKVDQHLPSKSLQQGERCRVVRASIHEEMVAFALCIEKEGGAKRHEILLMQYRYFKGQIAWNPEVCVLPFVNDAASPRMLRCIHLELSQDYLCVAFARDPKEMQSTLCTITVLEHFQLTQDVRSCLPGGVSSLEITNYVPWLSNISLFKNSLVLFSSVDPTQGPGVWTKRPGQQRVFRVKVIELGNLEDPMGVDRDVETPAVPVVQEDPLLGIYGYESFAPDPICGRYPFKYGTGEQAFGILSLT